MEAVCELLARAVEESSMTPTMRLMRQLAELNPKAPNEVRASSAEEPLTRVAPPGLPLEAMRHAAPGR